VTLRWLITRLTGLDETLKPACSVAGIVVREGHTFNLTLNPQPISKPAAGLCILGALHMADINIFEVAFSVPTSLLTSHEEQRDLTGRIAELGRFEETRVAWTTTVENRRKTATPLHWCQRRSWRTAWL